MSRNICALKQINDLMKLYQRKTEKPITPETYHKLIWDLSSDPKEIINKLKLASNESNDLTEVYGDSLKDLTIDEINHYKESLGRKFLTKKILIETIIEITCFSVSGVVGIRNSLHLAEKLSTLEYPVTIRLIKSPQYLIIIEGFNKSVVKKLMETTIETIKLSIEEVHGSINIIKQSS